VGYNPYRTRVARRSDILFVAAAIAAAAALVAWALFG
jgi:hypothetical protein